MSKEFNTIITNVTWTLVPASHATNTISCKWVSRTKHFADATIEQWKAQLVAKRFLQQSGIDYEETFNPVVKPTTTCLVLIAAVSNGSPIHQYDV